MLDKDIDEINTHRNNTEKEKKKIASLCINILTPVLTYTKRDQLYTSQETLTAIGVFATALKDLSKVNGYDQNRTVRLIEILNNVVLLRARRSIGKIEIFDYQNTDLRLKLSMWEDILSQFSKDSN